MPFGDFADALGRQVADSFALGLQMSAPFVVIGLTYYIGLGLLGRLMPQLPVFFFGLPAPDYSADICIYSYYFGYHAGVHPEF